MSRTVRRKLRGKGIARDGENLRVSRGCRHHGPCGWCVGNRTYSTKHRAPYEEPDPLVEINRNRSALHLGSELLVLPGQAPVREVLSMTLTELAQSYVGYRLTCIHEFCSNFEEKHRELRKQIVEEINPLLVKHGADPIDVDLVEDPDAPDDIEYDEAGNTWSG